MFNNLYEKVLTWARHPHAIKYLALVSFSEAIFFPIPVAIMLLPMCFSAPQKSYHLARITLIFSVTGGIVGYLLGWVGIELIHPLLESYAEQFAIAKNWFAEYGVWVVLMAGFSPVPYKIFTITAGLLTMPFIPFLISSLIGRSAQFFLIAVLVKKFGPTMEPKIKQYIEWIGWASVVIIGALILYLNMRG